MSSETPVSEVMTREVLTFAPTDQAHEAMETMVDRGIDGAPVVDADGTHGQTVSRGEASS